MAILQGAGSKEPQLVSTQLTLASTYLASFTLAQLALKVTRPSLPRSLHSSLPAPLQVSDASLDTADSLLKQVVPSSYTAQCEPIVAGIKKVRSQVEDVRREGARANGSLKVCR